MPDHIQVGGVHHLAITVSDIGRAREFYTGVLGFQVVAELPPVVLISNGSVLIGLRPATAQGDRFDEGRVGLDHLSFGVSSHAELEAAARRLDERGVSRGEIRDLGPGFGLYVMAFRDPDNIQLELSAPYAPTG